MSGQNQILACAKINWRPSLTNWFNCLKKLVKIYFNIWEICNDQNDMPWYEKTPLSISALTVNRFQAWLVIR